MQWLAMFTMLIDHAGVVYAPDESFWRIIGRIAFPLYCYGVSQGYRYTSNISRYLIRLLVIALLAQAPYMVVTGQEAINVVGTFLICCLVLLAVDYLTRKRGMKWGAIWLVVAGWVVLEMGPFEYGGYALMLMLAYRYLSSHLLVVAHLLLNIYLLTTKGAVLQMFSIVPTLWIAYMPGIFSFSDRVRMPRWVWRSFYPAHLLVLALIGF